MSCEEMKLKKECKIECKNKEKGLQVFWKPLISMLY